MINYSLVSNDISSNMLCLLQYNTYLTLLIFPIQFIVIYVYLYYVYALLYVPVLIYLSIVAWFCKGEEGYFGQDI